MIQRDTGRGSEADSEYHSQYESYRQRIGANPHGILAKHCCLIVFCRISIPSVLTAVFK